MAKLKQKPEITKWKQNSEILKNKPEMAKLKQKHKITKPKTAKWKRKSKMIKHKNKPELTKLDQKSEVTKFNIESQMTKQKPVMTEFQQKPKHDKILSMPVSEPSSQKLTNGQFNYIEERERQRKLKAEKIELRKANTLPKDHPDAIKRTIYVGNVNVATSRNKIKFFFGKFGQVETVRLRGVPIENINVCKKEAITMKKLHPNRKSIIAYVQFVNEESANKALIANGDVFQDHHLTVDKAQKQKKENAQKLTTFIGNLPFDIEEEDVWKFFEHCGKIVSVRIVRSSTVGSGKGFGFVCFENMEAVLNALGMSGEVLKGRNIRITRAAKKPKMKNLPDEDDENVSVLKLDKPEALRKKMQRRTEKLKQLEGASYLGSKSLAVTERKDIQKKQWKSLTKKQKTEKFYARSLGRKHTREAT